MTKTQLNEIDNALDKNIKRDEILINMRGYYIYYNEPNKKEKEIKIHSHNCGFCAWGAGRKTVKEVGKNGVWIGPFKTPEQAEEFACETIKLNKPTRHICIKKNKKK